VFGVCLEGFNVILHLKFSDFMYTAVFCVAIFVAICVAMNMKRFVRGYLEQTSANYGTLAKCGKRNDFRWHTE
jgi:hypothetical protein